MMLSSVMWIYLCWLWCLNGFSLPWSWDTVPLWADIGTKNTSLLSDYESQFMATHYNIISIEKCLAPKSGIPTEESFYKIAKSLRKYASTNETKILLYFATDMPYCSCYNITNTVCNNQSMWFRDDSGNILYDGNKPFYDHTQQYVRDWWINATSTIIQTALSQNIIVNGVFADGLLKNFTQNPNYNVSLNRSKEWQQCVYSVMQSLRNKFQSINNDLYIIGNGISTYPFSFPPNNFGLEAMPYVDGLMHGHYGSFEEVISSENGKINASMLLLAFNWSQAIKNGVYGKNKALLIKGWIGPESSPINSMGPSWPVSYDVTPTTHQGIQHAALDKISFSLATFLCGIINEYMYFGYAWFWDITEGWVPCPDNPASCDCPTSWYKEFTNRLGKPVTNTIMTDTYKCNRTFEYAKVYVNLNDNTSAMIQWL